VSDNEAKLDKWLQPLNVLRIYYSKNNINNTRVHIRAIVDGRIVYRVWSRSLRWCYYIEDRYYFTIRLLHGRLSYVGKDKN
jgi:hypothetical protein